jgi:hypothetical protein
MDRKQMCIANVQYKRPTPDDTKRAKNLLRYLTYRDGRVGLIKQVSGMERWVDRGMGSSVGEVVRRCDDLRSDHVLLFSLVCNPNPDLISMVAPDERGRFVRDLTERMVEDFFEARGLDTGCEFSYVMHHRLTDDPQAPGRHDPHTHVVLPGTVYDEEHGGRAPLYFSQNRKVNHIEMLHDVTKRSMVDLMGRYVGPDWEQRYDELAQAREQQRQVVEAEPHGVVFDDQGEAWNVWCGIRQTDEETTAVGFYQNFPAPNEDDPGAIRLEFRPLVSRLPHDQAAFFARVFAQEMNSDVDKLRELAEWLNGMSADQRAALVKEMKRHKHAKMDVTPDLEL